MDDTDDFLKQAEASAGAEHEDDTDAFLARAAADSGPARAPDQRLSRRPRLADLSLSSPLPGGQAGPAPVIPITAQLPLQIAAATVRTATQRKIGVAPQQFRPPTAGPRLGASGGLEDPVAPERPNAARQDLQMGGELLAGLGEGAAGVAAAPFESAARFGAAIGQGRYGDAASEAGAGVLALTGPGRAVLGIKGLSDMAQQPGPRSVRDIGRMFAGGVANAGMVGHFGLETAAPAAGVPLTDPGAPIRPWTARETAAPYEPPARGGGSLTEFTEDQIQHGLDQADNPQQQQFWSGEAEKLVNARAAAARNPLQQRGGLPRIPQPEPVDVAEQAHLRDLLNSPVAESSRATFGAGANEALEPRPRPNMVPPEPAPAPARLVGPEQQVDLPDVSAPVRAPRSPTEAWRAERVPRPEPVGEPESSAIAPEPEGEKRAGVRYTAAGDPIEFRPDRKLLPDVKEIPKDLKTDTDREHWLLDEILRRSLDGVNEKAITPADKHMAARVVDGTASPAERSAFRERPDLQRYAGRATQLQAEIAAHPNITVRGSRDPHSFISKAHDIAHTDADAHALLNKIIDADPTGERPTPQFQVSKRGLTPGHADVGSGLRAQAVAAVHELLSKPRLRKSSGSQQGTFSRTQHLKNNVLAHIARHVGTRLGGGGIGSAFLDVAREYQPDSGRRPPRRGK